MDYERFKKAGKFIIYLDVLIIFILTWIGASYEDEEYIQNVLTTTLLIGFSQNIPLLLLLVVSKIIYKYNWFSLISKKSICITSIFSPITQVLALILIGYGASQDSEILMAFLFMFPVYTLFFLLILMAFTFLTLKIKVLFKF